MAAPETANNVVSETAIVPLLAFGIPGSNSTAILLAGFLIHGLLPGPIIFQRSADVVHALYAGLFAASLLQFIIGIAILPLCLWLVNRPRPYLMAFVYALVLSGIYSINHSLFDLKVVLIVGVVGFFLRYLDFPILPAVLGVVLGYMVESNFRRLMLISRNDPMIFLEDLVSMALLGIALLLVAGSLFKRILNRRREEAHPCERHAADALDGGIF